MQLQCARWFCALTGIVALQDYVTGPMSRAKYTSGEPRSLQEAWAAGDMAVYPYAKSLATKTSISGLVIQKEWVQSLMEPNGEPLFLPALPQAPYCMIFQRGRLFDNLPNDPL